MIGECLAGDNNSVGLVGGNDGDAVGALDFMEGVSDGLFEVSAVEMSNELNQNFSVGFTLAFNIYTFKEGA
jgi:hypothetical protein